MMHVILTCEHAGNEIPRAYQHLFHNADDVLASHQALDIGAYHLAEYFSKQYPQFFHSKISRLLIELNRSASHPKLFSKYSNNLSVDRKKIILEEYYNPYRNKVVQTVEDFTRNDIAVLHLSIHTFTPELHDVVRNCDIGLLYDPRRKLEKDFCAKWKQNIYQQSSEFRVRYNYPYLGKADGFVTFLRKCFPPNLYMGIELEVNQKHFTSTINTKLEKRLLASFEATLNYFNPTSGDLK